MSYIYDICHFAEESQFWYHIENFWNNILQNSLVDYEISSRKFVKIY